MKLIFSFFLVCSFFVSPLTHARPVKGGKRHHKMRKAMGKKSGSLTKEELSQLKEHKRAHRKNMKDMRENAREDGVSEEKRQAMKDARKAHRKEHGAMIKDLKKNEHKTH